MRLLTPEKLKCLQRNPNNIRNLCIMAHVDHGKTTLADSLVASNGIISQKMAGKLRYMDSRKDEQERGITMKSSSITLYYTTGGQEYLLNLIDSPGHVDFSSEVSTAVRLCDGAIIVVDVVEGVCPQTEVALKQAWLENIKPVLVLNKIDRLILELKLTPLDAYIHMTQVLELVNVVMGRLFAEDVLEKNEQVPSINESSERKSGDAAVYDWSSGLEQSDDSNLYFTPSQGNVVFASALDGWAFSANDFAKLYSEKLGLDYEELNEKIWGDFYLNSKTKKICPGAQEKAKKPLFVQLVLENIWTLYDTICVRKDKDKLVKIVESLGIKVTSRDLRHNDPKVQLQAVCSQWLPVANSVLSMVCHELPAANKLSSEKVEKLMCSSNRTFSSYPRETHDLKNFFLSCAAEEAPTIIFVSKMFPVERKLLPENRPKALTAEELNARREQARLKHAEKLASEGIEPAIKSIDDHSIVKSVESDPSPDPPGPDPPDQEEGNSEDVFIAFARVYSGTVRPGQTLYVLGPKHDPSTALDMIAEGKDIDESLTLKDLKVNEHVTKVNISQLYIMMGRELDLIDEVPAGNVLGIGGLEEHVLKTATLSSVLHCPSFSELYLMAVPILRVAVEPTRLSDLPALEKGLRLLNQADACVQVLIQETGEHVLITAGEVHLERCLDDLRHRYAKVEINASEPIVPFRETVIIPPDVDMVNEAIQESNLAKKESEDGIVNIEGIVTIVTPSKQSTIRIQCVPLPQAITNLLEKNSDLIRTFSHRTDNSSAENITQQLSSLEFNQSGGVRTNLSGVDHSTEKNSKAINSFKNELASVLSNYSGILKDSNIDNIWCFGPRHCGPNVLLNRIKGYESRNVWTKASKNSALSDYDSSFVNGFQMATLAGPLCEEPMMGVAFVVYDWTVDTEISSSNVYGPLSGQIMSAVKEGCRRSFQAQPQRLMAAMYSCNILANAQVLGKLYAVLGRRQGRVLHGDMTQGSANFNITAILPVIESFNFAQEIRKQTSGLASPQLVFSHWEVIEVDPFWSPSTEEEYLHYGEKADTENKARAYMDTVRRRKGLAVQQKIVQFAEKQRTLSKKK